MDWHTGTWGSRVRPQHRPYLFLHIVTEQQKPLTTGGSLTCHPCPPGSPEAGAGPSGCRLCPVPSTGWLLGQLPCLGSERGTRFPTGTLQRAEPGGGRHLESGGDLTKIRPWACPPCLPEGSPTAHPAVLPSSPHASVSAVSPAKTPFPLPLHTPGICFKIWVNPLQAKCSPGEPLRAAVCPKPLDHGASLGGSVPFQEDRVWREALGEGWLGSTQHPGTCRGVCFGAGVRASEGLPLESRNSSVLHPVLPVRAVRIWAPHLLLTTTITRRPSLRDSHVASQAHCVDKRLLHTGAAWGLHPDFD